MKESKNKYDGPYHVEGNPNQCIGCLKEFSGKGNLKTHFLAVHTDVTYYCRNCEFKAKRKCDVKRHNIRKHGYVLKYNCKMCEFVGQRKSELQRHKREQNHNCRAPGY